MSHKNWQQEFQEVSEKLPGIAALTQKQNCALVVFDVESTQLAPGFKGFRIIELGFVWIDIEGQAYELQSFVDPDGQSIPKKIRELTGITKADVKGQKTWTHWTARFLDLAKNTITSGFNSRSFDCPAIRKMNEKKGAPLPLFQHHLDVKAICGKGNLSTVATAYGVKIEKAHRALPDAWMTARILDKIIQKRGADEVAKHIALCPKSHSPKPTKANLFSAPKQNNDPNKNQRLAILRSYLKSGRSIQWSRFAKRYKISEADLKKEVAELQSNLQTPPQ
ncbi:MAG: 3'-5' exonuclease [Planctomycetota bacterium]|nr:3'-5' exonuclease [Planctomycetota bacterium]